MSVRESVGFDLERIDRLIEEEEAELEPKHRASIAYKQTAAKTIAGGVASSWQDSPPHAIFIDRGKGSRLWDIDGNEYIDYHLGYGAMVVGHAHPKVVEAVEKQVRRGTHYAQPTKDLDVVGENLVERFHLPLWRFCNSGTEATLEAVRLMRAVTGRNIIIKIEGTYHGHHDSLMFSVGPDPDKIGPREHPVTLPQVPGIPEAFAEYVRVVPFNDLDEVRRALAENEGNVAGMIVEPAMMNCGIITTKNGSIIPVSTTEKTRLRHRQRSRGGQLLLEPPPTAQPLPTFYPGALAIEQAQPIPVDRAQAAARGQLVDLHARRVVDRAMRFQWSFFFGDLLAHGDGDIPRTVAVIAHAAKFLTHETVRASIDDFFELRSNRIKTVKNPLCHQPS